MNCLIENEYISGDEEGETFLSILAFPNELPNWKRIHKEGEMLRNMPAILKFSVLKINAEGKFCEILQSVAKGKKKK